MDRHKIFIDPMIQPEDEEPDELKDDKIHSNISTGLGKPIPADALEEAEKEVIKEETQHEVKLNELVEKTENVLYKARNIIPIFTSEIVIDTAKVTIIHRPFFFSERIHSIAVKDITDIYIETVPFLAGLVMVDSGFVDEGSKNNTAQSLVKVPWLRKNKAEKARRIITGLMETSKEEVDLKMVSGEDLAAKLEEIGRVREAQTTVSKA